MLNMIMHRQVKIWSLIPANCAGNASSHCTALTQRIIVQMLVPPASVLVLGLLRR
jgi:hypothetical protein